MNPSVDIPSLTLINEPVTPILKSNPESDETPYCALCLRERPPGAEFYEYSAGNASPEFRETMQNIVGLELNMEDNFDICSPCWKMIQLMVDFRLCCYKAQCWAGRYGNRGIKCSEEWFNDEVGQAIDSLRWKIQEHVGQIEGDEDYSEDHSQVEDKQTLSYEQVDRIGANEGVVTEISVGDFKIEVFDDVDQDTAEPTVNLMEQMKCEKCNRCYESKQALDVHIQMCRPQSNTVDGQSTAGEVQICTLCNAVLANMQTLKSHFRSVHGPKKHHCDYCPSKFARAYDLKKHCWALHSVDFRNKPNSPQVIQGQSPMRLHDTKITANGEERKIFSCKICTRAFSRVFELVRHHRIAHSANQASSAPGTLSSQVINKEGQKPTHQCPTCEKHFKKYSTLQQHMQRWHAHLLTA